MAIRLAIVGRPNVGKSTLFNRLAGKKLAIVDDQPGVTRDRREADGRLGDLDLELIDTAGFEDATDESLEARMRAQTEAAIAEADVCLFLVDARAGITPLDAAFGELLRKSSKPVILGANKAEGRESEAGVLEAYGLGFGEPVPLSGEHGEGMADLFAAIVRALGDAAAPPPEPDEDDADADGLDGDEAAGEGAPLRIAVIGRPNAGKSTLINALVGEERLLTGPEAGITRDAISVRTDWAGTPVRIFDTAGLRKRARVSDKLEKLSVADALRATRFAEVVVVLLDAAIPFETQDLRIADLAEAEGRAVVVAVNKWDLEEDRQDKLKALLTAFETHLPQLRGAQLVTVSARTGRGLDRLHAAVVKAHAVWNRRITTAQLNRWLAAMTEAHPPPAPGGRRVRIRYVTQVKTRPPTFVAMCSAPEAMPDSYVRYLVNGLRDHFDMPGTPIRFTLRGQGEKNPYKGRKAAQLSRLKKHLGRGPRQEGAT